jgi:hypothetical protein
MKICTIFSPFRPDYACLFQIVSQKKADLLGAGEAPRLRNILIAFRAYRQ